MTNKIQTMLTIVLTAAVAVLLVDRIIEPAQASDAGPHVLIGTTYLGLGGNSAIAQEFSSKARCEAGAEVYIEQMSNPTPASVPKDFSTTCIPK